MFLQFWYLLNILLKLILKRIAEGVYAVNEFTSIRINSNYCEYLQLITSHESLFIVITFVFCKALSCLVLALWSRSGSEIVVADEAKEDEKGPPR